MPRQGVRRDGRIRFWGIGIDIEQAATRLDLSTLVLTGFPGETHRTSA
jgi:hypothetical protein